nr:hypothetical protein [uncultured Actinotalea sp.]
MTRRSGDRAVVGQAAVGGPVVADPTTAGTVVERAGVTGGSMIGHRTIITTPPSSPHSEALTSRTGPKNLAISPHTPAK